MKPHQLKTLALVALFTNVMGLSSAASAQQPPVTACAVPLAFAVQLTLTPPRTPVDEFTRGACPDSAFANLRAATFQFAVDNRGIQPKLTIAEIGLTEAQLVKMGTGELQADGQGYHFAELRTGFFEDGIDWTDGVFHIERPASGTGSPSLVVDRVHVTRHVLHFDALSRCEAEATGTGVPDTIAPAAFLPSPCDAWQSACRLLPDGALTLAFSKPIDPESLRNVVSATDVSGAPLALFGSPKADATGYRAMIHGAWPLGHAESSEGPSLRSCVRGQF